MPIIYSLKPSQLDWTMRDPEYRMNQLSAGKSVTFNSC